MKFVLFSTNEAICPSMMTVLKKRFRISSHDYAIIYIRENITVQSLCLLTFRNNLPCQHGNSPLRFSNTGINLVLKTMPTTVNTGIGQRSEENCPKRCGTLSWLHVSIRWTRAVVVIVTAWCSML